MADARNERKEFTGADFLAGGTLPVELHLKVQLHPDVKADHLHIDPDLERRLQASTAAVLEWVARSSANGVQLLADPLTALAAAGVKLNPADRDRLAHALEQQAGRDVLPAGVNLASLSVETARSPAREKVAAKSVKRGGRHGDR